MPFVRLRVLALPLAAFIANADAFAAAAAPASPAVEGASAAGADDPFALVDRRLARLADLIDKMPRGAERGIELAQLDAFRDRRRVLATAFDETVLDDLKYSLNTAGQRLAIWLATKASSSGPAGAAPPLPLYQAPPRPEPLPVDVLSRLREPVRPARSASFSENDLLAFTDRYCYACHNDIDLEGRFDLTALPLDLADPANLARWVLVHDRIKAGEMPPKERRRRPAGTELETFLNGFATTLSAADRERVRPEGRSTQRRLNGYEFENALRDLLKAPWLELRGTLPEDGIAHRYNKVGEALDVSHVQIARFMNAAEAAMREVITLASERPERTVRRHYARDQNSLTTRFVRRTSFHPHPERLGFPIIGTRADPDVLLGYAPVTVGDSDPVRREQEAIATMHGSYSTGFSYRWDQFTAPAAGRYRFTFRGYTVWFGPYGYSRGFAGEHDRVGRPLPPVWYKPNGEDVSPGRRSEPITVYSQTPGSNRRVGTFDLHPEAGEYIVEAWMQAGERLWVDASRFFRSRPAQAHGFTNPLAQADGTPGVAFQWMQVDGPFYDDGADSGYRVLFDDLPLRPREGGTWEVKSADPAKDADRLLRRFMAAAYRRPVVEDEVTRYLGVVRDQMDKGSSFGDAMLSGYTAALISPGFLFLEEMPGPLDGYALASRLAFFLWNSPPDSTLRELAANGRLRNPDVLRAQTERMLDDPKARRFVSAFLDYWLDLRKMDETTPSITLYPDYYLDTALQEAAIDETQLYFGHLIKGDLPARYVVDSDFTFLNERLARHYGIEGVSGAAMLPYTLPKDSLRGGIPTQASVLKVTANGTTSSPVLRGFWITERILGETIPPPPPVAAVEPDIRGAVTIREQLEKHRADPSCASCHNKMDPPGFALEGFDVFGAYREHYRAVSEDAIPAAGFGMNGHAFAFHHALPVDSAGALPDGRPFSDIRDFKTLLLDDERKIAANLVRQLAIYATGASVGFADRPVIERILEAGASRDFGVRSLIHGLVQSELFINK